MTVTSTYASLLTLMFILLSVRVIGLRRRAKISLGDGDDPRLARRIRVHANFAEYVPLALILMGLAEAQGSAASLVHALGLTILCGRVSHGYGLNREPQIMILRVSGMALTFSALTAGALLNLLLASGLYTPYVGGASLTVFASPEG